MARPVFGRIVNVAERTIAKVESGDETPDKLKRPYNGAQDKEREFDLSSLSPMGVGSFRETQKVVHARQIIGRPDVHR